MPTPEDLAKQELTPALQSIVDMKFMQKSIEEDTTSRELSEEVFIKNMKYLIDGTVSVNTFGDVLNILERESIQGHPDMETFKQVVQDLTKQKKHKLELPEEYWSKLN